jgi:ABC-type multidrug transport system fused ATPase/permease subunit
MKPRPAVPAGTTVVAHAPAMPVRQIVRRFWPYAKPYRKRLYATLALLILGPIFETATIGLFGIAVDEMLVPGDLGAFPWIVAAFLGLTLLSGVVGVADDLLSASLTQRFLLALRVDVFRHVQGLSLDTLDRHRLGDTVSRLTGDVGAIESFVLSGVASTISHVVRIALFVGVLMYLQWDLALLTLAVAPGFWLCTRYFSRRIKQASRESRRAGGSISSVAEESISNAALVQAYDQQEAEVGRFRTENENAYRATMSATRLSATFAPIVELIEVVGGLAVMGYGTWALARGSLTIGALLAFIAYMGRLYSPIRGLSRLSNTIYAASAGAERVIELLDQKPAVVDRVDASPLPVADRYITFDNVSFRYPGTERDALCGVSFTVAPGETVALVGRSGAGKSTVAKLLLRFYDPASGVIALNDRDLRDVRLADLRANVTPVLQETLVFEGTVRDNIAYGRPDADDAAIERAARAADAHDFITALPDGYNTLVGQKGRRLSGGQRQRVAIARAMIRESPVLVLDEPTTGLDAESGFQVLQPLRRLMSGRATVVISHNLHTVRDADCILVMDQGCVVERGTHEELLDGDGLYAELWRLHQDHVAPKDEVVPA